MCSRSRGSPMNQAVYFGLLEPGDTILAMDLSHGGHLTHGAPVSHMGKVFNFVRYKTEPDGCDRFRQGAGAGQAAPAEDDPLRLFLLSARSRLCRVQAGGRRGRGSDLRRRLPYRRADRGRGDEQSLRRRLRRGDDDDAQVAARAARRHDPVPRALRQGDRQVGVSRACRAGRT